MTPPNSRLRCLLSDGLRWRRATTSRHSLEISIHCGGKWGHSALCRRLLYFADQLLPPGTYLQNAAVLVVFDFLRRVDADGRGELLRLAII